MASGYAQMREGAFIATGVDPLGVEKIGFRPAYLRLFNIDDPVGVEFFDGMDADGGARQKAGTTDVIGSGGVTLTDKGFSIGAEADLNTDGEQIFFVALGN